MQTTFPERISLNEHTGILIEILINSKWQEVNTGSGNGLVPQHYDDVIMGTIASQITSLTIVYSTVYSGADQSKHQSSASLAFVWGIHRGPVNSPHKWPVTRKMFPFDDVIMPQGNKPLLGSMQTEINDISMHGICPFFPYCCHTETWKWPLFSIP